MLDSHCHLNDTKLYSRRAEIIHSAIEVGVKTFLCVGWDLESSKKAVRIAHEYKEVYAAIGLHPENLMDAPDDILASFRELAKDSRVIAIGEIGLDYHWFKDPAIKENQKRWFIEQIQLANELSLPLTIHARDAAEDTFDILKKYPPKQKGVLHCYSGSVEMLKKFEELGMFFGFDGPITYKKSQLPKANVIACPLSKILTETDSPYLTPEPNRGKENEPKYIKDIFKEMAILKNAEESVLEEQIDTNFKNLFHVEPTR